jgi:TRAP-type C4-dicarboxylate transport system permease small subunit
MSGWLGKQESRGAVAVRFCALGGMVFLVALALIVILDVLMRWLFNDPVDAVADAGPLVMAIVVASTFPLAAAGKHNVTIGFLGSLCGPRARNWLNVFGALVTTAFLVLLAWQFAEYAIKVDARGQTTWVLRWPVAPWWSAVALLFSVAALIQVVVLARQVRVALKAGVDEAGGILGPDEAFGDSMS